ncbi:hypothetical protein [Rhizobium sp. RAF56]|uniref:hypothetical protein n=1 Tax=Rhizobium sp. RAF56 TaxID=3233062 RepID=UPI003F9AF3D8
MGFYFDGRVVLNNEPERSSLYRWGLREVDADGNGNGLDQIPWAYDLYFTVRNLRLSRSVLAGGYRSSGGDDKAAIEKHSILADLVPGDERRRASNELPEPSYAMLGTNRKISTFELWITPLPEGDVEEHCTAWGAVKNRYEIDFRHRT